MTDRAPILVTGTHRSGTTWMGRMLDLSPTTHYVHEPFAPMNHRSWLSERPVERYLHQSPHRPSPFDRDLERIVALRPPALALLRRSRGPRDVLRAIEQVVTARRARMRDGRAIIKDPFALLLAEWIHARTDAEVVVCVRHPAAFVSSVKRLEWRLDERWLLVQDELMSEELRAWAPALRRAGELDTVDHACLVWRVLNSVVIRLEQDHPEWTVTRYEDLALRPVVGFRHVFEHHGLAWSTAIADEIGRLNSAANPTEVPVRERASVVRDSRGAVWTWRDRLTEGEIDRVHRTTSDVASHWYGDAKWWEAA